MHHHLARAAEAIEVTTRGLDAAALALLPPGRWSRAQVLEHLTLAFRLNAAGFEAVATSGQPRARRPTMGQRAARIVVVDVGYFPRAKAPDATLPADTIPPDAVRAAALEAIARLDAAAARALARFGPSVRLLNHPYFGGMTTPEWLKFHWRHTVHHMRQVRAISRG